MTIVPQFHGLFEEILLQHHCTCVNHLHCNGSTEKMIKAHIFDYHLMENIRHVDDENR